MMEPGNGWLSTVNRITRHVGGGGFPVAFVNMLPMAASGMRTPVMF